MLNKNLFEKIEAEEISLIKQENGRKIQKYLKKLKKLFRSKT
jgi:hypothetical protein